MVPILLALDVNKALNELPMVTTILIVYSNLLRGVRCLREYTDGLSIEIKLATCMDVNFFPELI